MNYIENHPILGKALNKKIEIEYDGKNLVGYEGQTVAAILTANGIRSFRYTALTHESRGLYCGIGQCTDCIMVIDGRPNIKACMTLARNGMKVETQHGMGKEKEKNEYL